MIAIAFAVGCVLFSGLLDLVFKIYVLKSGSRGLMIAGVALIWGALQALLMFKNQIPMATDNATLFYGGFAALALTVSNLALLECLAKLPISIASTIYRLNTIPLVLMAVIFLGEDLDVVRISGVVVGLLAVALLHSRTNGMNQLANDMTVWFWLIIFASCVRAAYGILTKAGLSAGASADSMMILAALGWFFGGVLYFWVVESKSKLYFAPVYLITIAGALVFSVVWLLTNALSRGDASIVVPIANMGFVMAFIFSLAWKLEYLTLRKSIAILSAIVSIVLLTFGILGDARQQLPSSRDNHVPEETVYLLAWHQRRL